MRTELSHCQ